MVVFVTGFFPRPPLAIEGYVGKQPVALKDTMLRTGNQSINQPNNRSFLAPLVQGQRGIVVALCS